MNMQRFIITYVTVMSPDNPIYFLGPKPSLICSKQIIRKAKLEI